MTNADVLHPAGVSQVYLAEPCSLHLRVREQLNNRLILDRTVLVSLHEASAAMRVAKICAQGFRAGFDAGAGSDGALAQLGERLNRIQ